MRSSAVLGVIVLAAACSGVAAPASSEQTPPSGRPAQTPPKRAAETTASTQKGRAVVDTGVVGSVVLGPGSAFGGMGGGSGAKPVAAAKIVVSQPGEGGAQVATTTTDETGHYEVAVPPGTYTVTLETTVSFRLTKDVPATVTVTKGQRTTLNVLLDTGRR
jgi:Carboxypeptidase regulatory-like domain